jgi:hypothetical protein
MESQNQRRGKLAGFSVKTLDFAAQLATVNRSPANNATIRGHYWPTWDRKIEPMESKCISFTNSKQPTGC